jgi:hypothetical protein
MSVLVNTKFKEIRLVCLSHGYISEKWFEIHPMLIKRNYGFKKDGNKLTMYKLFYFKELMFFSILEL